MHDASLQERLQHLPRAVDAVVIEHANIVYSYRVVIRNPLRQKTAKILRANTRRYLEQALTGRSDGGGDRGCSLHARIKK